MVFHCAVAKSRAGAMELDVVGTGARVDDAGGSSVLQRVSRCSRAAALGLSNRRASRATCGDRQRFARGGAGLCGQFQTERIQVTVKMVGGQLLAVGYAVGAGVGGWQCLWGRVRAGVFGGYPTPSFKRFPDGASISHSGGVLRSQNIERPPKHHQPPWRCAAGDGRPNKTRRWGYNTLPTFPHCLPSSQGRVWDERCEEQEGRCLDKDRGMPYRTPPSPTLESHSAQDYNRPLPSPTLGAPSQTGPLPCPAGAAAEGATCCSLCPATAPCWRAISGGSAPL